MLYNLNIKRISLALGAVAVSCFVLAAILFFQIDVKAYQEGKNSYTVNENKSFSSKEINEITVNSFEWNVNILESEDFKVNVNIHGKMSKNNEKQYEKPIIELSNGVLNIEEKKRSSINFGIKMDLGQLFNQEQMRIDVYIPKEYKEKLNIDAFSGNVKSVSLNLSEIDVKTFSGHIEMGDVSTKTLRLDSSSGEILTGRIQTNELTSKTFSGESEFEGIFAENTKISSSSGNIKIKSGEGGTVKCETFSGEISFENASVNNLDASCSSGEIYVTGMTGDVNAKTFSGDVEVGFAKMGRKVKAETSSGGVKVTLPSNSQFELMADTLSGEVNCEFPIAMSNMKERNKLGGIVGNGENKLLLNTFSGDIDVLKGN